MTRTLKPLTFTMRGQTFEAEQVRLYSDQPKPRPQADAKSFHKGWQVEGFKPGRVEAAAKQRAEDCARWSTMTQAERADAVKRGRRAPLAWDEARYVAITIRDRAGKPFSVESSAQQCAGLAERAGWTHVRVTELKRGTPDALAV